MHCFTCWHSLRCILFYYLYYTHSILVTTEAPHLYVKSSSRKKPSLYIYWVWRGGGLTIPKTPSKNWMGGVEASCWVWGVSGSVGGSVVAEQRKQSCWTAFQSRSPVQACPWAWDHDLYYAQPALWSVHPSSKVVVLLNIRWYKFKISTFFVKNKKRM